MPHSGHGLYHVHKRKKAGKYRQERGLKKVIDYLIYPIAFIGPLMTVPQVIEIWMRNSSGVSFISWFTYLIVSFFWLTYAMVHREKPMIVSSVLWIVLEALIVAGLVLR